MEVKEALADKNKEIFSIIYFIYIFSCWKANRGAGNLLIDPLNKINIFFYDNRNKKESLCKVLTRLARGRKKVVVDKIKGCFTNIFTLFIY